MGQASGVARRDARLRRGAAGGSEGAIGFGEVRGEEGGGGEFGVGEAGEGEGLGVAVDCHWGGGWGWATQGGLMARMGWLVGFFL